MQNEDLVSLVDTAEAEGIEQLVVGAIIPHESAILLLRRPETEFMGGIWELPSGKVEPGEGLAMALSREVLEETGLTVTALLRYLGSFDYLSGSGKHSRQFNFAIDVAALGPIKLSEHDAHRWAPVTGDLPVTGAVKAVLGSYQAAFFS